MKFSALLILMIPIGASSCAEEKSTPEETAEEEEVSSAGGGVPNAGGQPLEPANEAAEIPAQTADELLLSDDFADPATLVTWRRVWEVEQWPHDQLEQFDIGTTREGWMTMMPYSSGWYNDYRGVLAFKQVTGNFVVTTHLEVSNRAGTGAPSRSYSLAGIMVRQPKAVLATAWQEGREDYIFLSLGTADQPGTYQTEVKTTNDSRSILEIDPAGGGVASIRSARIGSSFVLLIKPEGGEWQVHRRYSRSDFTASLQVGLTAYTDWPNVESRTVSDLNNNQITDGEPDLIAQFDYVAYAVPVVPEDLVGRDFSDPAYVSDAEILSFLGGD